jgi:hypothetical protein
MSKVTTLQEYVYRSAHELARLVREGHATSVDIVKEHLVPWKRDDLHKSRSAAPGWQGAKSELIGHK